MAGKVGGGMHWLVYYDIQNARNRRNVLKILRSGSLGYQKLRASGNRTSKM